MHESGKTFLQGLFILAIRALKATLSHFHISTHLLTHSRSCSSFFGVLPLKTSAVNAT